MSKKKILVGQVFGRLTVVRLSEEKGPRGDSIWVCSCSCESKTVKLVKDKCLKNGDTQSCGCILKEREHGMVGTPEYRTWTQMRNRCRNPKSQDYPDYGGRGITVCERWDDFKTFYKDMGPRPPDTSIDRIDNNKGYSPDNCRWASGSQQAENRRGKHLITFRGVTKNISLWARDLGTNHQTLHSRLNILGWSIKKALTTPINKNKGNWSNERPKRKPRGRQV